jgi:uracil-DNA glycosylase family 4
MDALRRNQYLETIGVDVWVSRHSPASAGVATSAAVAAGVKDPRAAEVAAGVEDTHFAEVAIVHASGAAPAPLAPDVLPAVARVADVPPAVARGGTGSPPAVARGADVPPAVVARGTNAPPGVTTWESLRSEVLACTKCALHATRTQGVFGVGSREAQWLVVGEAPGAEEDRRGEPFVGRAGHLLDAMLKAIGLSRGSNVYIANVLKSRPPGNRDPKPEEVAACLPYLMRQIELLRPRVMLAVGRIAAQNLLSTDAPLGRLRGKVHHFGELNTPLIVTYHPAYLLRTPGDKRKAWEDLKFARSVFQALNPT